MGWFEKALGKSIKNTLTSIGPPELRGYKNGTTYVPQTKQYLVHKGEMVIPVKEATVLRRKMAEKKKKAQAKKAPIKKTKNKK